MRTYHNRRGFTLIELLVTMGLIILLLSIAIAVSSSATLDSYKINAAGDRLSQSLITAKARAARDKSPRGIRLIAGADGYLRELVYIEQPDPWLPDQSATYPVITTPNIPNRPQNYPRSLIALRYLQNPSAPAVPPPAGSKFLKPNSIDCNVYLLLSPTDLTRFSSMFVSGQTHIASSPDMPAAFAFDTATPVTAPTDMLFYGASSGLTVLRLSVTGIVSNIINPDLGAGQSPRNGVNPPYQATFQTTQFGIYLPAKPLAGEPSIILSKNAAVDPLASSPSVPVGQNTDILFAPAGHVMFRSEGVIAFLIRDTFKSNPQSVPAGLNWLTDATNGQANFRAAGEMLLISIFPRTGAVAAKPVAEPDGTATSDPYRLAKDAISGGL